MSILNLDPAEKINRNNVMDLWTLSPQQEGILFHYLQKPSGYVEQVSCILKGKLLTDAFQEAWGIVLQKNDMLRTIFRWGGLEKPVQIILKEVDWSSVRFIEKSMRELSEPEVHKELEREREKPFDLRHETVRILIVKHGDLDWQLILTFHHILLDGWSMGVLFDELFSSYNDICAGETPFISAKASYRDFIKYHQALDKTEPNEFWKDYMKDFAEETRLSAHAVSASDSEFASVGAHRFELSFSPDKISRMKRFCVENRVTLATFFYIAWSILLAKYSHGKDIVFGTTVSGRNVSIPNIDNTIGLFINTVPFRICLESEETVSRLLTRAQDSLNGRQQFEHVPLYEIKALLGLQRMDLFDSILVMENYPLRTEESDHPLKIKSYDSFSLTHYNLVLMVVPHGDKLKLVCDWNPAVFSADTLESIMNHMRHVLEQMVNQPEIRFREIQMATEREKKTILEVFNRNDRSFPNNKTYDQLFEEQAKKTPSRTAVECLNKSRTYQQLNEQANQLAGWLVDRDITNDSLVILMGSRSIDMLIGILAVFKAGGAYVPMDPNHPSSRNSEILRITQSKVMIVVGSQAIGDDYLREVLAEGSITHLLVLLDNTSEEMRWDLPSSVSIAHRNKLNSYGTDKPDGSHSEGSLAYVIYTSGSTGMPKGAMVEHVGMINHMYAKIGDLALDDTCVVAQNAPHCFDISVWQFLLPLVVGGRTVIVPEGLILDCSGFLTYVEAKRMNVLELVPSYLDVLLEQLQTSAIELPELKWLVVTGEAIKPKILNQWFKRFPDTPVVNAYGPTEASDDITHHVMEHAPQESTIPIGKPIANMRIYIVDHEMSLCPPGVKGEICVSGIGIGRGYFNDPHRTEQVFGSDPFYPGPRRLYKTGDLGSWRQDGAILYHGRKDDQVKIRGNRIEMGEIENTIVSHQNIKQSAVIYEGDDNRNGILAAFFVADRELDGSEVKEYIKGRLPAYMLPDMLIQLSALPLTSNGKVDKKQLKHHGRRDAVKGKRTNHESRDKLSEIEDTLRDIWGKTLGAYPFSIDEHFFDAGGNSILLMRVFFQLENRFPGKLHMTDLFDYSTIRSLARKLEAVNGKGTETEAIQGVPLPFTFFDTGRDNQKFLLEFKLDGDLWKRLKTIASHTETDVQSFLTVALSYSLSVISETDRITIYYYGKDQQREVTAVRLDFPEEAALEALLKKCEDQILHSDTRPRHLASPPDGALVLVADMRAAGATLSSFGDLSMCMHVSEEEALVAWEYNDRRLNGQMVAKSFRQFAYVLRQFASSWEF